MIGEDKSNLTIRLFDETPVDSGITDHTIFHAHGHRMTRWKKFISLSYLIRKGTQQALKGDIIRKQNLLQDIFEMRGPIFSLELGHSDS